MKALKNQNHRFGFKRANILRWLIEEFFFSFFWKIGGKKLEGCQILIFLEEVITKNDRKDKRKDNANICLFLNKFKVCNMFVFSVKLFCLAQLLRS